MPDFLVLKKATTTPASSRVDERAPIEGSRAEDWQPVLIALGAEDEATAARQAYSGEGTYKVLPWDDDAEVAVTPGEPEVEMVSKREVAEAAEAEAAEAVKAGK